MISARELHDRLLAAYGPQHWWPADNAFEVMVGALLVQRTAWSNAARAIARLETEQLLTPAALARAELARIEQCCRPAGFFRSKAVRLRRLGATFSTEHKLSELALLDTAYLRDLLLDLSGIGPETADAILLYGFGRPAIVVDEYLRRLYRRLSGSSGPVADGRIRDWIEADLAQVEELSELHALVVAHGKAVCRKRSRCADCQLRTACQTGVAVSDPELGKRVGDLAQYS